MTHRDEKRRAGFSPPHRTSGDTAANDTEKQAWDAYVQARIDAALQSPLLSEAESKARLDNLLALLAEKAVLHEQKP